MDDKPGKKKESIDEILSDLNGLLNKMPSILDGIRMPEIQPMEPSPSAVPPSQAETPPDAGQEKEFPPQADGADKTVVLEAFSGLPEGSATPEDIPAQEPSQSEIPQEQPAPEAVEPSVIENPEILSMNAPEPQEALPPAEAPARQSELQAAPEIIPEPEADKTMDSDIFSGSTGGETAPQPAESAPSQEFPSEPASEAPAELSGLTLEPPAEQPVQPSTEGHSLSISEFTPPQEEAEKPADSLPSAMPEASLRSAFDSPLQDGEPQENQPAEAEEPASLPAYDNTRDFGIPDIDALLQLSEKGTPSADSEQEEALPEAGVIPESVQAIEKDKEGLSIQGLDQAAPPEPAAEGVMMETNEPKEGKEEILQSEAEITVPEADLFSPDTEPAVPEAAAQAPEGAGTDAEISAAPNPFDVFAIDSASPEPVSGNEVNLQESASREQHSDPEGAGLNFETPADTVSDAAQEPQFGNIPEPVAQTPSEQTGPGPEAEETLTLEPAAQPQAAQEGGEILEFESPQAQEPRAGSETESSAVSGSAGAPQPGGIELSPGLELSVPSQLGAAEETMPGSDMPSSQEDAGQTMPGTSGLELDGGPSGDETLVVAPAEPSSGEEEKTVIFQAPPAQTSRAQAADLSELADKGVPEGVPEERVRSLVFIYSPEDKALCATVLAELDSICLKSATKPMFIKRASVKECEPDANANFLFQSVAETGAQGMVCVGGVPQDKIYELENVFNTSGGFFRAYDASSFNHSAALDLITDLIVR